MKNLSTTPRIFAIIAAAFLWAVGGVFFVPKLYHINVHLVVFIQHIIPAIFLLFWVLGQKKIKTEIKNLPTKSWRDFSLVSLFGGFLGTYAITQAFFTAYASQISLSPIFFLQKLQPIFAVLAAVFLLKEHLSKRFWQAGTLAIIGSYLLTFGFTFPELSTNNQTLITSGWALLAAFSWGISTTISKKSLQPVSPLTGTFLRFLITSLIAASIIIFVPDVSFAQIADITAHEWKIFGIIAATTGGLALWLYYWGLKKISASNSAIYEMSMPFFALGLEQLLAPILLENFTKPSISYAQILGGIILAGGILYLSQKKTKEEQE